MNDVLEQSTLTLFEARVFLVDDIELAFATNDLAIFGNSFDAALNFHCRIPLVVSKRCLCECLLAEDDTALGEVIGTEFDRHSIAGQNANVELSHLATDVGKDFLVVFEFDSKACIGKGLGDFGFKGDFFFFGHTYALTPGGVG